MPYPPPHRNTISTPGYQYDPRGPPPAAERTSSGRYPTAGVPGYLQSMDTRYSSQAVPHAQHISTSVSSRHRPEDDERTPIAPVDPDRTAFPLAGSSTPVPKYECSYCGKGFNRPSSLKVCAT